MSSTLSLLTFGIQWKASQSAALWPISLPLPAIALLLPMRELTGKRRRKLAHIFKADLPGLKKEEVKVEIEEGKVLQISGKRNREVEDKNDTWHRVERRSGKFLRRFRLPKNVKIDGVKAKMENGVLTVTVPKEEEKKKQEVKSIEISG